VRLLRQRLRDPAVWILVAAAFLLAVLYLVRLGSDPPGLYDDEASIGYNAWTIAHFAVDQYGNHFPLFFADFGDYKGPVATYMVAPLTLFLPLSSATVRLPSVLSGIAVFLLAGHTATVLTGSRRVGFLVMLLIAIEPWVFLMSQVDMEGNIQMVLAVTVACWCLAEAERRRDGGWWWGAGAALGVGLFTYSIARLLVPLLLLVALTCFWRRGGRALRGLLLPPTAGGLALGAWWLDNPGALLARYSSVGLFVNHPPLLGAAARFATNYLTYLSPQFLLLQGDGNFRQTTGLGGVLPAVAVPLIIVGIWRLWRRRHEPYARFILLGALVAPIPAALTLEAPYTLRGAGLIPFFAVFLIEGVAWTLSAGEPMARAAATGWGWLLRPRVVIGLLAAATLACAVPYFADYFTAYPARATAAFETGEGAGLVDAWDLAQAGGHRLFLSAALNQPLIQLQFAVEAPPPQPRFLKDAHITVVTQEAQLRRADPGDIGAFSAGDEVPPGSTLLFVVRRDVIIPAPIAVSSQDLMSVYRLG
jgi:4-amino-4-deoxy-L-arabinose transferase-like glycosyltransferase